MFSRVMIFVMSLIFSTVSLAAQIHLKVLQDQAPVLTEPRPTAKVMFFANRGRQLISDGVEREGYWRLLSKSGRSYWISRQYVQNISTQAQEASDDLVTPSAVEQVRPSDLHQASDGDFPHFSYDLGASFGSYDDSSYTEVDLGLNTYFKEWLIWRNALFGRWAEHQDAVYGLDSSVRAAATFGGSGLGIHAFAGPGYRFVNRGDNVPFAEAGMIFRVLGFQLGGGAKVLYYSAIHNGYANDTLYFIILSGGGSF